jgi:hypothetical protein
MVSGLTMNTTGPRPQITICMLPTVLLDLIYPYYAKPDGALIEWECSSLLGPWERDGGVTSCAESE